VVALCQEVLLCQAAVQEVPFPCPCKVVGWPWPCQAAQAAVRLLLLGLVAAALPLLAPMMLALTDRRGADATGR